MSKEITFIYHEIAVHSPQPQYSVHSRTAGGSDIRYFSRRFHSSIGTEQRFGISGFLFARAAQVFGGIKLLFEADKLLCGGKKLLFDSVNLLFAIEKLLFSGAKLLFGCSEQRFFSPSLLRIYTLGATLFTYEFNLSLTINN